jgi:hypothetical protein
VSMKDKPTTWCGCCGRAYNDRNGTESWCDNCVGHVSQDETSQPWDATFYALTGKPCPYQVNEIPEPS